jgi:hypothetical protein
MSGPLKNPRWERFVQGLLEGKSAVDAHEQAGFVRDDGNSARLSRNPAVRARLSELQEEIAAKVPLTIENLIDECEEIRIAAKDKNQFAAAMKAVLGKAQLSGLLVEKRQVEITGEIDVTNCKTPHETFGAAVDEITRYSFNAYDDYTDADREHLIGIYQRAAEQASEYIESVKARPPRIAYSQPKALPSPHTNGKAKS